jgi:hypothetical protein
MWRYEDQVSVIAGSNEDSLHVLDGLVFGGTRADRCPIRPFFAQHVVLRVDEDNGSVRFIDFHGRNPRGLVKEEAQLICSDQAVLGPAAAITAIAVVMAALRSTSAASLRDWPGVDATRQRLPPASMNPL